MKRHGKGKLVWADGSAYDGFWRQNLMHGRGTLYDTDGKTVKYTGDFIDGKPAEIHEHEAAKKH